MESKYMVAKSLPALTQGYVMKETVQIQYQ